MLLEAFNPLIRFLEPVFAAPLSARLRIMRRFPS